MVIARVDLSGNINSRMAKQFREVFAYVEHSNKIKGLVIVLNSGGGEASSSEILMEAVMKIRKRKPVYSIIEGIGASGAYWIASASSRIYAMNTSITGSIGVIGITPNVRDLLNKIGVRVEVTKRGKYKDMLNPFIEMDESSWGKYNEILDFSYTTFKNSVAENRKLSAEDIEKVATGEIFTSQKALDLGLIDKIGNYDTALDDLTKSFGLKRKVRMYSPHRTIFERLVTSTAAANIIEKILDFRI